MLLLAGCLLWLLPGCRGSRVEGRITIDRRPGAGRVNLMLVRGNLLHELSKLAAKFEASATRAAARTVVAELETEVDTAQQQLTEARSGLGGQKGAQSELDCLAEAEREVTAAELAYREDIAEVAPSITAMGLDADEPREALISLEKELNARLSKEAEGLRSGYIAQSVTWHSEVVFTASVRTPDRLCWRIENNGHLNLLGAELRVRHDGRPIPTDVARLVWTLSKSVPHVSFSTRNLAGEEVRGLAAGERFEHCYYAETTIPIGEEARTLASHGVSRYLPSRSGRWSLEVDAIELTDAAARAIPAGDSTSRWEFAQRPVQDVFEAELRSYREGLPQTGLIRRLGESASAVRLAHAEQWLRSCQLVVGLKEEIASLRQTLAALQELDGGHSGAEVRLRPIVTKLKRESKRVRFWVDQAERMVSEGKVASQHAAIGESYVFGSLDPGDYTVVGILPAAGGKSVAWLVPVRAVGTIQQDLGPESAVNGSLTDLLEKTLVDPPPMATEATAGTGSSDQTVAGDPPPT